MHRDDRAGDGGQAQHSGAEPVPDGDPGSAHAGRDGVGVAAERDQALRGDGGGDLELGRGRRGRAGPQAFAGGQGTDGGALPVAHAAAFVQPDAERVEAGLRCGDVDVVGQGPPPALRGGVVGLLDHALAVAAPRRADVDRDGVVLRDRGERRRQPARGRIADGGHPVEAPPARQPAQRSGDRVDRLDQVRLVLVVGQHPRARDKDTAPPSKNNPYSELRGYSCSSRKWAARNKCCRAGLRWPLAKRSMGLHRGPPH